MLSSMEITQGPPQPEHVPSPEPLPYTPSELWGWMFVGREFQEQFGHEPEVIKKRASTMPAVLLKS